MNVLTSKENLFFDPLGRPFGLLVTPFGKPLFSAYTSDIDGDFRIQYHRFTDDSPLHPLIKTVPHVGIQVDNLEEAVEGYEILLGSYEPISGYRVAIINDGGVPVELIETNLTPSELWGKAKGQKDLDVSKLNNF
jgi:hypothetical protein